MSGSKTPDGAKGATAPPGEARTKRRDFLDEIAGAALGLAGLGAVAVTVKYLSPNVLFEPPSSFRAGSPDDYPVDSVTYFPVQQVFLVRVSAGFMALSSICTHLGCITQWKQELGLIACPCHGSRFGRDGSVLQGPAPRGLPHFAIRQMADGSLLVDKLEIVPPAQILRA